MYEAYYGFKQPPFSITPDTSFFINLESHRACLNLLTYAVKSGEGIVKIVGEVGTGKTLTCHQLMHNLPNSEYHKIYLSNPNLTPIGLRRALAYELGIDLDHDYPEHILLEEIYKSLSEHLIEGQLVVLLIDEAQTMPESTLEELRLLSNLETEKRKLIQVVLFGQPELDKNLSSKSLRQLRQRIAFTSRLGTLQKEHIQDYINHRIAIAGYSDHGLFDKKAYKRIEKVTGGVPRLINIICHKALLAAYGKSDKLITEKHIKMAVADTESLSKRFLFFKWPRISLLTR